MFNRSSRNLERHPNDRSHEGHAQSRQEFIQQTMDSFGLLGYGFRHRQGGHQSVDGVVETAPNWPFILPSSVICDGWFLCDSQLTQPGEGT